MTDGLIGIILLLIIASGFGYIFHRKIKDYRKANIISAITSGIVLHMLNYIWLGYVDPFFIISLVVAVIISFLISGFIGKLVRRRG